jgi:hypothetical protein
MLGGFLVTTAWRIRGDSLQILGITMNILNKQSRRAEKG